MIEFFTSSTFRTVLSALNSGFLKTLQLFFITLIGALPLGLVISFGSMSRFPPLRWLTRLVVWVIRGTPLVLQIIALFRKQMGFFPISSFGTTGPAVSPGG